MVYQMVRCGIERKSAVPQWCQAYREVCWKWPVGQAVKTAASHAANGGSIPPRVTIFYLDKMVAVWYADKASKRESVSHIVRVNGDEGTPVPIPNTVVKLVYGDNTWLATAREDNSARTQNADPKGSACCFR